jgi:topoisomerase-4 subunit A
LEIKGRGSKGNIVTKYPIRKVTQLEIGQSSLGAQSIWMDEVSGRINKEERGKFLGQFDTGDKIIALYKNGTYETSDLDYNKKFDAANLMDITKFKKGCVINCIYFEGSKSWTMVKRFLVESKSQDNLVQFISDHPSSKLYFASMDKNPVVTFSYKKNKEKVEEEIAIKDFIDVKGVKALGNKLGEYKILKCEVKETKTKAKSKSKNSENQKSDSDGLAPGDTIEFDF